MIKTRQLLTHLLLPPTHALLNRLGFLLQECLGLLPPLHHLDGIRVHVITISPPLVRITVVMTTAQFPPTVLITKHADLLDKAILGLAIAGLLTDSILFPVLGKPFHVIMLIEDALILEGFNLIITGL
jgi:hypothetical protein